jgi:hypothetical protein
MADDVDLPTLLLLAAVLFGGMLIWRSVAKRLGECIPKRTQTRNFGIIRNAWSLRSTIGHAASPTHFPG